MNFKIISSGIESYPIDLKDSLNEIAASTLEILSLFKLALSM
jgi:hypothetical protein